MKCPTTHGMNYVNLSASTTHLIYPMISKDDKTNEILHYLKSLGICQNECGNPHNQIVLNELMFSCVVMRKWSN